jgi:hypothetical protein
MTGIKDTPRCSDNEHNWINPYPYPYTNEVCSKCYMTDDEYEDTQPLVEYEVEVSNERPF